MTRFWMYLSAITFRIYCWAGRKARKSCKEHDWDNEFPIKYCKKCHWGLMSHSE